MGAENPKDIVLKKHPSAKCYERGYDKLRRCTWWQVWDEKLLLGMAKSARGAWRDAWRRL